MKHDKYKEDQKKMKYLRNNFFRMVSGGKDNAEVKPGQDLYDFTSHYISVRRQPWAAPDKAGEVLRAIEGKTGAEYTELRKWAKSTLKGKTGSLTLKEILTATIEHPSYQKISRLPDEFEHVKSYRLDIIKEIVQKFRDEAWQELIGERRNIERAIFHCLGLDTGIISNKFEFNNDIDGMFILEADDNDIDGELI